MRLLFTFDYLTQRLINQTSAVLVLLVSTASEFILSLLPLIFSPECRCGAGNEFETVVDYLYANNCGSNTSYQMVCVIVRTRGTLYANLKFHNLNGFSYLNSVFLFSKRTHECKVLYESGFYSCLWLPSFNHCLHSSLFFHSSLVSRPVLSLRPAKIYSVFLIFSFP